MLNTCLIYLAAILFPIFLLLLNFKIQLTEYLIVKYDISAAAIRRFTEGVRFSIAVNPKLYKQVSKDGQQRRLFRMGFMFLVLAFLVYTHISIIGDFLGSVWMILFYGVMTGIILYMIYPAFTIKSRLLKYQSLDKKEGWEAF
jgi:hypothetical protein